MAESGFGTAWGSGSVQPLVGASELPAWAQRGESFELTLSVGGQYAGTQQWTVTPGRGAVTARVDTEFGGTLPHLRVHQVSRLHPHTLALLTYAEGEGPQRGSSFELSVDYRAGEVRLRQRGEETSVPLISDYLDPVSLLLWVREWSAAPGERRVVRLAGSGVHVQRLDDEDVAGQPAEVFLLRPGSAGVWRSAAAPHRFLRLTQPTPFGVVTAEPPDIWSASGEARASSGGPRTRRRVTPT